MLSNIEFAEQFLVWREQPEDRSPEAFQDHLQSVEYFNTIDTIVAILESTLTYSELPQIFGSLESVVRIGKGVLEGNVKP